ncbi:hypothetical protein DFJ73DRAFT_814590 [Zopfochytrium polystomum]|nr:hypothetical protein DFJ73DRAFT_814590 [Zopfochytrium polystomum]
MPQAPPSPSPSKSSRASSSSKQSSNGHSASVKKKKKKSRAPLPSQFDAANRSSSGSHLRSPSVDSSRSSSSLRSIQDGGNRGSVDADRNGTTASADGSSWSFLESAFPDVPDLGLILKQSGIDHSKSFDLDLAIDCILRRLDEGGSEFEDSQSSTTDGCTSGNGSGATTEDSLVDAGVTPLDVLFSHFPQETAPRLREALDRSGNNITGAIAWLKDEAAGMGSGAAASARSEEEKALRAFFPNEEWSSITRALRQCGNDVQNAADWIAAGGSREGSAAVPAFRDPAVGPDGTAIVGIGRDYDVAMLAEMFPNRTEDDLRHILKLHGGLHRSIDYLSRSTEPRRRPPPRRTEPEPTYKHVAVGKSGPPGVAGIEIVFAPKPAEEVTRRLDVSGGPPAPQQGQIPELWMDPDYCRGKAAEFLKLRNECFHRAANMYRKGNITGRGSAAYYSTLGREHTAQMEVWNARAAEAITRQNAQRHGGFDPFIADVHGLTRKEAIKATDDALEAWIQANRHPDSVRPVKRLPLRIITGAGAHSSKNRPVLLPALLAHVKKKGWRTSMESGDGSFLVLVE